MDQVILYIILIGIFFTIGYLLSILLRGNKNKNNIENAGKNTSEHFDYDILEALEYSKQSQINYLSSKINDINTKLEIIESQLIALLEYPKSTEQKIHNSITDSLNHNKSHNITSFVSADEKNHNLGNTVPEILNFLTEPKTSIEIKNAIGKTREHTARLMKKLYEINLVERDTSNKPFKYKITELGKKFLSQPNTDLDTQFIKSKTFKSVN